MAITGAGSTLTSLPCESLALIASQLQGPDRRACAIACKACNQAASLTTRCLVVPGQQLLAVACQGSPSAAFSSCDCACCADEVGCPACTAACASGPEDDEMGASTEGDDAASREEEACSWLQRYSAVHCLTITSCDSCQGAAAGVAGRARALCSSPQGPCRPHTPAAHNFLSSVLASKTSVVGPHVSLSSFLAAAGSCMPYLQQLDLSTACACLDVPAGVLDCLSRSCPHLSALSLPTWLLQPAGQQGSNSSWYLWGAREGCGFDGPALKLAAAASWDPAIGAAAAFSVFEAASSPAAEPYGLDRLRLLQHQSGSRSLPSSPPTQVDLPGFSPQSLGCINSPQQQQQQPRREQLGVLAGLENLTSLKLCGAAPPAAAVKQLAQLTQLLSFSLVVRDSTPDIPAALSQLPGWQEGGGAAGGSDPSDGDGSTAGASSGALLGASLALLPGLTSLSLSGALHAGDTLKALTGLPGLACVELSNLSDFAVGSLANLACLTGLTSVRVRGCRALQATARSALPLQLQALQELEVLDLDFDLHLRDMQVLCLLKCLTHLTAKSFHHCIHLMPSLSLPALRCLRIANVSRLQPQQQQAQQQVQQLLQQHGLPALAAPGLLDAAAAAAAPEAAAALAAVGGEAANGDAVQAAAAAGVPVVPLSALPVLVHLHQQQQPGEQPPYLLLAAQGGNQALLLLHNHHQQQQQQHAQPLAAMLQGYNAVAPQHAAGLQQQPQQQQQHIPQQPGPASGVSLQLLQLRQQQLYLQQQQLRLQQQQVRLQLQQMQSQLVQHANQNAAAATGVGQAPPPPPPPHAAPQQQQQQQQAADPVQAAAGCMARGWLVVLFPGLEELHLTSAKDCAVALPAVQGHPTLQRLVVGTAAAGRVQQQQQGKPAARLAAGCVEAGAAGAHSGRSSGCSSGSAAYGGQCAGLVAAASRGVSAPWGVLRTLPCLEELEILETAAVLGGVFSGLGMAAAGQLVRLVLRGADSLSDFSAATLLGPFSWSKLSHLEIEGAEGLSNRGLGCLAGLPALQSIGLSYCSGISAGGLGSFLLSSSSNSLRRVDLLCCAGVSPIEAQTVQDAVWAITRRRVEVSWSRHDLLRA